MKNSTLFSFLIHLMIYSLWSSSGICQEVAHKVHERKMNYTFTIGLVTNEESWGFRTDPLFGGTISLGAFYRKWGAGIRYRKDLWYQFGPFRNQTVSTPLIHPASIDYYEESFFELYKTFRFKSPKAHKKPQFTIGSGYGWIYPYYTSGAARVMSVFASVPVHWITLEARIRPFLDNRHQRIFFGRLERANPKYELFTLSLQTTFPWKYYRDKRK